MNGYVQDERYAAGAGSAGAASLNIALSFVTPRAQERLLSISHYIRRKWRRGGEVNHRDMAQVRPCSLFLDFLSRKVPVVNLPTPALTEIECLLLRPLACVHTMAEGLPRGCLRLRV